MKLYRFIGATSQKAITKANEQLGPNALVYSTRKIAEGVEILAGIPSSVDSEKIEEVIKEEVRVEDSLLSRNTFEKLSNQLDVMDESIKSLSNHITMLNQIVTYSMKKKQFINWNVFKNMVRLAKKRKEARYAKHITNS